jgi:hypothetical protein
LVDAISPGLEGLAGDGARAPGWPQPGGSISPPSLFWDGASWIDGADGKARRVVADLRGLVDGLPEMLVRLGPEYFSQAEKAVIEYAEATQQRPGEVLREVQRAIATQEIWQKPRGFFGISEAEILQPYLREFARRKDESGPSGAGPEISGQSLRGVRIHDAIACPSQERGFHGQQGGEYPDSLHLLSQFLASAAGQAFEALRRENAQIVPLVTHGIPNRSGMLRGFGNAIVPQAAAEFISAFIEARGELWAQA